MEYTIHIIYSLCVFITGTLFGSFFSLATYRLPRKQDITHERSYCPNCKHKLGFFDLFPILSYISTIGRCKYCNKKISIRYPLMELASGFVFLLIYLFFGFSWKALILVICYIYLFLVIGTDIMKNKMTEEEKKEVEMLINARKQKKNQKQNEKKSKAGSINIEVLVAGIIFVFFFLFSTYTISNYTKNLEFYKRKIEANTICLNLLNEQKSLDFENVINTSSSINIDNVEYNYQITYSNNIGGIVNNNAKYITITVSYVFLNTTYDIELNTLKVV